MTQLLNDLATVLQALALIALYWGSAPAALALAYWVRKRSQVRYHVGNVHSRVPVQTFRSRRAAVRASLDLYRAHGRAFRITSTR